MKMNGKFGEQKMEQELKNKLVKLIFEDGNKSQVREGKVIAVSNSFIKLSSKNREELIPLRRILRIQLKGGGN